jgi:predicted enzyme related to lactoylglutathione lyase
MLKVSSVLIGVKSLEDSKVFYEQVFGFFFDEFRPPFASATFDNLEFNLEEDTPEREPLWAKYHIGGRKQISFKTLDMKDFLLLVERHGGKIIQHPKVQPWNWLEAIIVDPSGNEFIIECPVE